MLDGTEVIYVARAAQARIMAIDIHVGTRLPAYCTSMGRVMLAHLPERQLNAVLRKIKFESFTPKTVRSGTDLRQRLSERVEPRGSGRNQRPSEVTPLQHSPI
jgi:IclR family transcriptional regulator, pca regulon regulatory protein